MTIRHNKSDDDVSTVKELQALRYNLFQSVSWLNNGTRQLLQPFDITPKQYSILRNLAKKSPESSSIQEVRDGLADKMSDASRLIDRLVKKGFLDKFPSDYDRRSNRVSISEVGLKLLRDIEARREELDRLISDRLDETEIAQLNDLLSRLK